MRQEWKRQPVRRGVLLPAWAAALVLAGAPAPLLAQADSAEATVEAGRRQPFLLWTRASRQNRVLWGQWTRHLSDTRTHISNDRMMAVVYRGYFAATFRTTHDDQGWSVGIERAWIDGERGVFGGAIGFRAGLVYGYDEQLGWLAEAVPILPFASPLLQGWIGPLSLDATHTWVVVSLTAGIRF